MLQDVADAAQQVDLDGAVERGRVGVQERSAYGDSGVDDEGVEPAEVLSASSWTTSSSSACGNW